MIVLIVLLHQTKTRHQKHLRHKNTKGNVKGLPLFLGRPLFFYGYFYFNLKKRSYFLAQARPLPEGDGTNAQPRTGPSLITTVNLKKIELSHIRLEHAQMLDTGSEHCCRVTSTREQTVCQLEKWHRLGEKNLLFLFKIRSFKIGKTTNIITPPPQKKTTLQHNEI